MKFLSIDHIQLSMPAGEEEVARAFYAHLLGFAEVPKPPELAKRGGLWFEQGAVKLHLGVEENFHALKKAHPALIVDNLAAFVAHLRSADHHVDTSQPPLDGYGRVHVIDPFGNRLEIMEKLG
jgi:catechol 2,3-dioxygenase-like lactoylglutathione lyase family enzyme